MLAFIIWSLIWLTHLVTGKMFWIGLAWDWFLLNCTQFLRPNFIGAFGYTKLCNSMKICYCRFTRKSIQKTLHRVQELGGIYKNLPLVNSKFLYLQIFIIFSTLCFLSVGAWGALNIRQEFDPVLLLPAESYLRQWIDLHEDHWPQVSFLTKMLLYIQLNLSSQPDYFFKGCHPFGMDLK